MGGPLSQRVYHGELDRHAGKSVTVAGWLQDVRNQGSIAFLFIRDRTGVTQAVLKKNEVGEASFAAWTTIPRESVVAVSGTVALSKAKAGGFELAVGKDGAVSVVNPAEAPLPLGVIDKVGADIDTRIDNRPIDLRKPDVRAIFQVRSAVVASGIQYFLQNGFVLVTTPRIIGSSSEGGTDLFPVRYFERDAYLSQSPQLYKQMLMASGLDRVFEIATYFRAEKHNTPRHLNEITAFDAELAFVDSEEDVLRVLEGLIRHVWLGVKRDAHPALEVLKVGLETPPERFLRVPYDEAVERVNAARKLAEPARWGEDLSSEAERVLGDELGKEKHHFYFITRYPEAVKPFYVYSDDGASDSRSFDLEYRGVEVTSGAQREHRVAQLEARIRKKGLRPQEFEAYLRAFRHGMPPHGGFGLGIDRLTMVMLGLQNVREAVLFPRDRTRLSP